MKGKMYKCLKCSKEYKRQGNLLSHSATCMLTTTKKDTNSIKSEQQYDEESIKSKRNYDEESIKFKRNYEESIRSKRNYDDDESVKSKRNYEESIRLKRNYDDDENVKSKRNYDDESIKSKRNYDEKSVKTKRNDNDEISIKSKNNYDNESVKLKRDRNEVRLPKKYDPETNKRGKSDHTNEFKSTSIPIKINQLDEYKQFILQLQKEINDKEFTWTNDLQEKVQLINQIQLKNLSYEQTIHQQKKDLETLKLLFQDKDRIIIDLTTKNKELDHNQSSIVYSNLEMKQLQDLVYEKDQKYTELNYSYQSLISSKTNYNEEIKKLEDEITKLQSTISLLNTEFEKRLILNKIDYDQLFQTEKKTLEEHHNEELKENKKNMMKEINDVTEHYKIVIEECKKSYEMDIFNLKIKHENELVNINIKNQDMMSNLSNKENNKSCHYESTINNLNQKIEELEKEMEKCKDNYNEELDAMKVECQSVNNLFSTYEIVKYNLTKEIEKKNIAIDKLEIEMNEYKKQNAQDVVNLNQQFQILQTEKIASSKANTELMEQIAEKMRECEEANNVITKLTKRNQDLDLCYREMSTKYKDKFNEKETTHKSEIAKYVSNLERKDADITLLQETMKGYNTVKTHYEEKIESLKQNIELTNKDKEKYNELRLSEQIKNETLNAHNKSLSESIDQLKKEHHEELQTKIQIIQELQTKCDLFIQNVRDVSDLENVKKNVLLEKEKTDKLYQDLLLEKSELIEKCQIQTDKLYNNSIEIMHLTNQIVKNEEKIDTCQQTIGKIQFENEKKTETMNNLTNNLKLLTEQLEARINYEKLYNQAKKDVEEKDEVIYLLNVKLEDNEKEIKNIRDDLKLFQVMKKQLEQSIADVDAKNKIIELCDKNNIVMKSELIKLQEKHIITCREYDEKLTNHVEMKKKNEDLSLQINKLRDDIDSYNKQLETWKTECSNLGQQIINKDTEISNIKMYITKLSTNVLSYDEYKASTEDTFLHQHAQLVIANQEIIDLKSQIEKLEMERQQDKELFKVNEKDKVEKIRSDYTKNIAKYRTTIRGLEIQINRLMKNQTIHPTPDPIIPPTIQSTPIDSSTTPTDLIISPTDSNTESEAILLQV